MSSLALSQRENKQIYLTTSKMTKNNFESVICIRVDTAVNT